MAQSNASFSITTFRKRGVLTRIFWSFLALSLALLVLFLAAGIAILNDRYEEQTTMSIRDMLDKAQIASSIAVEQTLDNIRQITQNESIISAIAVPDIKNGPRAIEIVNHLQYVQQQSRYIESLYFYSGFDDAVYSSLGFVSLRENFFGQDVIDAHQRSIAAVNVKPSEREKYDFFVYKDQVYVTYAFPVAAPYENGTIYAKLSKSALSEILNLRTREDEQYIQLYTPDNEAVLNVEQSLSAELLNKVSQETAVIPCENGFLFLSQAPDTGLKYAYYQSSLARQIPLSQYLMILLPLVPVILLASLLMSVYLTEYLYKPIRRMMKTISGSTYRKEPAGGTELDYLGEALTDFVVRNEDLTRAIAVIRPEMEQKVFHAMVSGTLQESEFNEELLQTIQLSQDARCTVLAIQVTDANCQPLGKLEANMCLLALRQLVLGYTGGSCTPKLVEPEDGILAVAMTFPPNTQEGRIQQEAKALEQFIRGKSGEFSCQLFTAVGGVYPELQLLHTAYTDACQSINYQKYFKDDEPGAHEGTGPSFYRNYIISQLEQALQDSDGERAEKMLTRALEKVFEQFEENGESMETVRLHCNGFIDLIIGQMSDLNCGEEVGAERSTIAREIDSLQDSPALLRYMKKRCLQLLQIIVFHRNKQQNKYIAAAKDYIHEHYSDYTLSLDTVAQKIGIHPNYLSRLFKETLNINFVEYLNKQRIEKAKVLLTTTRMMVKDIGFEVGFNSVQNYLRVFKKYENMTPKQYRESHGGIS